MADGCFLPVDYGVTLFAGETNDEHLNLMGCVCDVIFLLEGGPGAATQAKAALLNSDLIPVVPVVATGGAAAGMFGMPPIQRPLHIDSKAWDIVAGASIDVPEEDSGEAIHRIATAMARITHSTMNPVENVNELRDAMRPETSCGFISRRVSDQVEWVSAAVQALKSEMLGSQRLCILGPTSFHCPETEALVARFAHDVSVALEGFNVVFVTGGLQGVQETFAKHCGDGSRVWNLLPMGRSSGFGIGKDVTAGSDFSERMEVFGALGDVYVTFEGGPGVAKEATSAFARGAYIVPFVRTGGASSGLFDFPKDALQRPDFIDEDQWEAISSSGSSIEDAVATAVFMTASYFSKITAIASAPPAFALPYWQLSESCFEAPLVYVKSGRLRPFHTLLRLCEKSFRTYGRWSVSESLHLKQVLSVLRRFFLDFVEQTRDEMSIELMMAAYVAGGSKFRRVYSTIVDDVISQEEAFQEFSRTASVEAGRLSSVPEQTLTQRGFDGLIELYRAAHRASDLLDNFCAEVAKRCGAEFMKAPLKRLWRSLEKMIFKYSDDRDIAAAAADLKDVSRAALQGNMQQLLDALRIMTADTRICIVRIKNRFSEPTDMGWADCQVMLFFREGDGSGHICEIQLVHHQLMIVRKNMGAHKTYANVRSAAELLELHKAGIPSLKPKTSAMHLCNVNASVVVPFLPQHQGRKDFAYGDAAHFLKAHVQEELQLHPSETSGAMAIVWGIANPQLPLNGCLSLRWESAECVVFDNPLCYSPIHLIVMPTAWRLPSIRCLQSRPDLAKQVLKKMRQAGQAATGEMLRHVAWRDLFFRSPVGGWPDLDSPEELGKFCSEYAIAGFDERFPENQLCMHWIVAPVFPWQWHRVEHGLHWLSFDEILDTTEGRLLQRRSSSYLSDRGKRFHVVNEQLANWRGMFDCVAVGHGSVNVIGESGCLTPVNSTPDEIQREDTRRLGSYGQPRTEDGQATGSYYSFPKRPQDVNMEFVNALKDSTDPGTGS
eukprot:TRINITY_DN41117_c0_g3_i1.p1 TRINITY_DN41117_c0_g3~~TRINITY_DN41117_c0_g3_i1.p1  ORF type:complete len:1149 (-),score=174.11 TRINITY_DN41117_c0_g3_i1:40-3048(-)